MGTLSGGPNIVVDGLVLNLDAANTKSYPGSGTTWTDLSRSGNNGTLINGPTFNSGNGGSIVFDGVNDFSNLTTINIIRNFTVSAWIYPTSLKSGGIVSNGYYWVGYSGWALSISNTNSFGIELNRNGGNRASSDNTLTTNSWNHITGVCINGSQDIKLYLNGIETTYKGGSFAPTNIQYFVNTLGIGYFTHAAYSPGNYFSGRIANVQIYNKVLSPIEILQNYNATKGRFGL